MGVDVADEAGAVEARAGRAAAVDVAHAAEPLRVVDDPHAEGEVRLGRPRRLALGLDPGLHGRERRDDRARVRRRGRIGRRRRVPSSARLDERLQQRDPERERHEQHGYEEAASQHGRDPSAESGRSPSGRMSLGGLI